ncbi:MAG: DNA polymerase/3'-5' exonuclease PolX [Chitinophagaceae bacterium]
MDNYEIADQLSLLSKMMDIHGENAFKSKSFSSAAFTLEKYPEAISSLSKQKISSIRGIGESVGNSIFEILETGKLEQLEKLISETPKGVLEMMNIKGLGPKKIHTLWKELNIDTIDDLKQACQENVIADKKGFGAKTQQNILEAIHFQQQNSGKYLYAQVEGYVQAFQQKLEKKFNNNKLEITGAFRRQSEVIDLLEWVTTVPKQKLISFLQTEDSTISSESDQHIELLANDAIRLKFYLCSEENFINTLFTTTGNDEFIQAWKNKFSETESITFNSEDDIFKSAQLNYVPPYLRETEKYLYNKTKEPVPPVLQTSDVKGLIHSHSTWSDGAYSIEDMAKELIELGFEYLVISDHSKAAYYANGLDENKIRDQHKEINELNKRLAPFKIFKSIECDILTDGALDFEDSVLSTFDLVIASVHSNLTMSEEKAMHRLLSAVKNPYVTILGHMTGRLLTRRNGYPVNHKQIIDACAEHKVVIEINANPKRLDMDWRWIDYALENKVLLSVNPDAHSTEEFQNIKYGVLVAQKGGLTKEYNLSSYSLCEFENFLQARKKEKNIM